MDIEIKFDLTDKNNGVLYQATGQEHIVKKKSWKFDERQGQREMLNTLNREIQEFSKAMVNEMRG
jgi:hypothetical protein